ncbi:MAG: electron transport complex protein RnfA, partial [Fusobacteriaceae bacterium]
MDFGKLFSIIIGAIFINNFIFAKFLGICPFMGVSKKVDSSIGMGMAVTFVITLASGVTWVIYYYILDPLGLGYLQTITFILIIASLVQFVEMAIQKTSPGLYKALGVFLPLITTN